MIYLTGDTHGKIDRIESIFTSSYLIFMGINHI